VSIVRVGLAETKHFSEGYEAIFGKKKTGRAQSQSAADGRAARKARAARPKTKARAKKSLKKTKK